MRTKYGGHYSILHPTYKLFLVGVARVTATVGIHVRNTTVCTQNKIFNFLCKITGLTSYIACPLNGVAVRSTVLDFSIFAVG